MMIICRSLDITDKDVINIVNTTYNDITSLILKLSKHGVMDPICIKSLLNYLSAEGIDVYTELTESIKVGDFLNDKKV